MFTGIITEIGEIRQVKDLGDSAIVTVAAPRTAAGLTPGASVAVAGVCLTATAAADGHFSADVMRETMTVSTLGQLAPGTRVNLEPALSASGRLDGHLVQGHVDGRARLAARAGSDRWEDFFFEIGHDLARYVARKGSIAIDGVSLTVTQVWDTPDDAPDGVGAAPGFGVSLIPTTVRATTLGSLPVGAVVNIETDVLARYVERLSATRGEDA